MMQPLALVLYERLLPGSQLVNRLQDMSYRVQTVADAAALVELAERFRPMLLLADFECSKIDICAAIARLKQNDATKHIPVIGFGGNGAETQQSAALAAGVTLLVSDTAILHHLSECLDRALQVE